MKNKLKVSILLLLTAGILAACGENEEKTVENSYSKETSSQTEETTKKESQYPFPSDTTSIGSATVTISTPAGDSQNGNVPVLYVSSEDILIQIGANFENFDGSLETYVYINGIYDHKGQYGELSQTSLNLSEDNLKPGNYTVTAIQFENNDPNGKPVVITEAKFQIIESQ